jgi:AraC-like DNA-binding protein
LSRLTANSDLFSRSWVFDGNTAHNAAGIMEEINTAAGMARLGSFFRLVELLSASDEKVPLNVEGYVFHRDGEDKALLDEAIRYILASLPGDIRLDEVASHVRMSSSAFSRFFKHNVGRPFVDYVRTVRIARACWLLSETERPITEICFEVGYYNISNFNRSFRAERNMTPREYRGLSRLSIPSARTTSEGRALPGDRASQGH